jgi:hypothetical protein
MANKKIQEYKVVGKSKPIIIVGRSQFYRGLVLGFLMMLVGGYELNMSVSVGSGILGFGLAMVFLLLIEAKFSIGRIK